MKLKIIELLQLISQGIIPKRIIYDGELWIYEGDEKNNYASDLGAVLNWDYVVMNCLNDEIELIDILKGSDNE